MASSIRELGTSMRDGALQLWPLFIIITDTPAVDALGEVVIVEHDVGALAAELLASPA